MILKASQTQTTGQEWNAQLALPEKHERGRFSVQGA